METKRFTGRAVLQAYTGILLTDIGDLYQILNHCTRDDLMTHQLPRVINEVKPWLSRWFPELQFFRDDASAQELLLELEGVSESAERRVIVARWYGRVAASAGLKDCYDVPRIPVDDHDRIHPLCEEILRGKSVIAVAPPQ